MKFFSSSNMPRRLSRYTGPLVVMVGVCIGVGLIGCGASEPKPRDNAASETTNRVQTGPANIVTAEFQNVDPE